MMDNLIILHLMVCEQKGNNELHVTSINYDNDIAMDLVKTSESAITIHGCLGEDEIAYIGGKDNLLKERIVEELSQIGIEVKEAPSHMSGTQDNNIVNCTKKWCRCANRVNV